METFTDTIDGIDIVDDEGLGSVGDLVKMLQRRRLKLEDKRKSLVGPLNKVVKDINDLFKAPRDSIDLIVRAAKAKMNKYAQAQQAIEDAKRRKEREDAERDRKEAQEVADNLARLSDAGNETAAVVVAQAEEKIEKAAAPAKVETKRGEQSAVVTQKKWKADVDDLLEICKGIAEGKLPTHFVEPNMRALQDFARELKEEQTTHGIRVYQDISTVVR
jgi:hypothetical protein